MFRQDLVDIVVKLCEICCTFLGTKDLADIGQLCAQNLRVPGADDDDLYPEGFQLLDGILPGGVAAGEEHFRARCGDRLPVGAVEIAGIRKARKFGEVVLVGGIFLGVGRLVDRHDRVAGADRADNFRLVPKVGINRLDRRLQRDFTPKLVGDRDGLLLRGLGFRDG